MSQQEDNGNDKDAAGNDPLERTMAEAVAAVESVRGTDEPEGDADAVDEPESDEDPLEAAQARIATLQEELGKLRDKWLRSVADHENYKKRTRREIDDAVQRAVSGLLQAFFPVADNLERAMAHAGDEDNPLVQGIKMVSGEFYGALAKHGITPIESVGTPFDPAVHDALQQIDSPDHAPGIIIQEFEKGYRRGERLLRPARVILAGPGSTGAPPASSEDSGGDSE